MLSFEPPPKRKGESGKYRTSSHHGLAIAVDPATESGKEAQRVQLR